MGKVALRAYNREIETLIDQGHTEEAVAHCMHILKTFPKHLETYRLMGKAYLEAHRYTEAADIFLRVLLAVPDDFVSHLGMSIVNDEKHDLNGAIWHMERAFEINSTNGGIQSELRRLYGRRDGVEPERIHLTRGALAQIYMKAGEYQQSITEIKAVLGTDETRTDMKTLLASAYFRAGMKKEAVESSIELLKLYPYSLDGNRIIVEILPGTSMAQGIEQYQRRIRSLDPYAAAAPVSVFDTHAVPDEAVTIERLDWEPGQQQAHRSISAPAPEAAPAPTSAAQPAEDIPGWMKQSGWGPSNGETAPETAQSAEPADAAAAASEIAAAEIPDWLKAMAPPAAVLEPTPQAPAAEKTTQADESADFDWLDSLGAPSSPTPAATSTEAPSPQAAAPADADNNLDWLNDLAAPAAGVSAAAGLDWLNDASASGNDNKAPEQPAAELPDWLSDLNKLETPSNTPLEAAPDWLKDLSADTPPPANTPAALQAEDSSLDWLQNLAAEQPAQAPAPVEPSAAEPTPVPSTIDSTPDWMKNLAADLPASQAPAAPKTPAAEPTPAPAEADNNPDWMKDLASASEQPSGQTPPAPGSPAAAAALDSIPEWMKDLAADLPAAQVPAVPETPAAEAAFVPVEADSTPDWMKDLATGQPAEQTPAFAEPPASAPAADDSIPDWLKNLAGDQHDQQPAAQTPAVPETPAEAPTPAAESETAWMDEFLSTPTEPLKKPAQVDDWLETLEEPTYNLESAAPEETNQDQSQSWWEGLEKSPDALAAEPSNDTLDRLNAVSDLAAPVDETPAQPKETPLAAQTPGEGEQEEAFKWLEKLMAVGPAAQTNQPAGETDQADAQADDSMEWLSSMLQSPEAAEQPQAESPAATVEPVEAPAAENPAVEPVKGSTDDIPPLSALVSGPGTSASEQDDALAWLESLAQKQGAKPEELITPASDRSENAPSWVTGQPAAQEPAATEAKDELSWLESLSPTQEATTPTAEEPDVEPAKASTDEIPPLSALVSGPGTSASEQDDALAWLESLAQKQGAKPEELITPASDRSDNAPSWVTDQPAAQEPAAETPAESSQPDAMSWLESLSPKQEPAAPTAEEPAAEPVKASSDEIPPLSALVSGPGTSASEQDDALAWLESLAQKQGAKPEELITPASDRSDNAPSWVTDQPAAQEPAAETPSESIQPDAMTWLESLTPKQEPAAPTAEEPAAEPVKASSDEIPPLSALVSGPGTSASEQDDALAWLESLAQKQGAKPEELITPASDRSDNAPSWVTYQPAAQEPAAETPSESIQRDAMSWLESLSPKQEPATMPAPEASAVEPVKASTDEIPPLSALVSGPGTSASEQDDALAWLESLAQKQGAKPEELITPASDRSDNAPSWVTDQPAAQEPSAETPAESSQPDAMTWLESLSPKQEPATMPAPEASAVETPEAASQDEALSWLASLEPKHEPAAPAAETPAAASQDETEDTSWLESLMPQQESAQTPAEKIETTPSWLTEHLNSTETAAEAPASAKKEEVPDWLESLMPKQQASTPALNDTETPPSWVTDQSGIEEPAAETPLAAKQADIPDWLGALSTEKEPAAAPAESSETPPSWITEQPAAEKSVSEEQDDFSAWLELLASKKEPAEAAQVTETLSNALTEAPAAEEPTLDAHATAAAAQADIPDWLGTLAPQPEAATASAEETTFETPAETPAAPITAPEASAAEAEDDLSWLGTLAPTPAASAEETVTPPAEETTFETSAEIPAQLSDTQPTKVTQVADTQPGISFQKQPDQAESQDWPKDQAAEEEEPQELMPQPDLKELGTASAGHADAEAAAADLDWLGDLSKPQEPIAAQPTGPEVRPSLHALPDAPDVSIDWLLGKTRQAVTPAPAAEEPTPASPEAFAPAPTPAVEEPAPAAMETRESALSLPAEEPAPASSAAVEPAAASGITDEPYDWYASLGQPEGSKTVLPMPWEKETAPAEAAADELTPIPFEVEESALEPAVTPTAEPVAAPAQAEEKVEETSIDESAAWLSEADEAEPQVTTPLPWEPASLEAFEPEQGSSSADENKAEGAELDETAAWLAGLSQPEPKATSSQPWEAAAVEPTSSEQAEPAGSAADDVSAWLASLDQEEAPQSAAPAGDLPRSQEPQSAEQMPWESETASESAAAKPAETNSDISEWLMGLDEKDKEEPGDEPQPSPWLSPISAPAQSDENETEDLPDWLKDPAVDEHASGSWFAESQDEPVDHQPEEFDVQAPYEPASLPAEQAAPALPAAPAAETPQPEQTPSMPARTVLPGGDRDSQALQKAREVLADGSMNEAMREYSRLIKKGKALEDVIYDLQQAVYSHPVDVIIWQTLGDAYFRANRLQEALDAYSKAEGLLR